MKLLVIVCRSSQTTKVLKFIGRQQKYFCVVESTTIADFFIQSDWGQIKKNLCKDFIKMFIVVLLYTNNDRYSEFAVVVCVSQIHHTGQSQNALSMNLSPSSYFKFDFFYSCNHDFPEPQCIQSTFVTSHSMLTRNFHYQSKWQIASNTVYQTRNNFIILVEWFIFVFHTICYACRFLF